MIDVGGKFRTQHMRIDAPNVVNLNKSMLDQLTGFPFMRWTRSHISGRLRPAENIQMLHFTIGVRKRTSTNPCTCTHPSVTHCLCGSTFFDQGQLTLGSQSEINTPETEKEMEPRSARIHVNVELVYIRQVWRSHKFARSSGLILDGEKGKKIAISSTDSTFHLFDFRCSFN